MAEDAAIEFVDLTLRIQAEILIDLAADFGRVNHFAAAETIRNIEERIARDLRERAIDLRARRFSAEGIAQVAGYLADTIEEARQKMAENENSLRPANGGILAHILKFLVELKERLPKLHFATSAKRLAPCPSPNREARTKWFCILLGRLRHSRDRLRCPACWRWASPKIFAKRRYLLGTEQLACEHCGEASVAAAWRLRAVIKASLRQAA
jgi:hypothetical protein